MINETAEFEAYTGKVKYAAGSKRDSTYLGRFTYGMLTDFEGLNRVLTIIARGYMWKDSQKPDIDRAKEALCAWCSVPEPKKDQPKKAGQSQTDFGYLHEQFPELVDSSGNGWFYSFLYFTFAEDKYYFKVTYHRVVLYGDGNHSQLELWRRFASTPRSLLRSNRGPPPEGEGFALFELILK